jgi:integrase
MATFKISLDSRRAKKDGTFNVVYRITHKRQVYSVNSGILVYDYHWDEYACTIKKSHPNSKQLNLKLISDYYKIQEWLIQLGDDFAIEKLRALIDGKSLYEKVTFKSYSEKLISKMMEINKTGNALVYQTALNSFTSFCGNNIEFQKIDYRLLDQYNHFLTKNGLKLNTISNYFRTIRAIYNKALKEKIVDRSLYPFHDISIRSEKTAKRAVLKEDIAKLLEIPLQQNSSSWRSLNYFMLSFYLRGISFTDLAYLKQSNIIDGRIVYRRRKTHKDYSVKLFPVAETIINQMHVPGSDYLLPIVPIDVPEDSLKAKRLIQQYIKSTNKYLKRLSVEVGLGCPVTTYSSRHSFATIAKRMGYSNELIAEALGHEYGNKITNIYLDTFDVEVLDAMHQQVIS